MIIGAEQLIGENKTKRKDRGLVQWRAVPVNERKKAKDEVKKKCTRFIHGWISFLINVLLTWNVTSNGWSVLSVV